MKLMNEQTIQQLFAWDKNIVPVALLPIGYPLGTPAPRKRLPIEVIAMKLNGHIVRSSQLNKYFLH